MYIHFISYCSVIILYIRLTGAVDPVTLLVTLSDPIAFADDSTYGTHFAITNINKYQYMAVYYNDTAESPVHSVSAVVMRVTIAVSGAYIVAPWKAPVVFPVSSLTGVIRATTLSSGEIVIAYSDNNSNNGVTCVLIKVNPSTGLILFGSQWEVTTGTTVKGISTGTMNINLVTIGTGYQFMVMFSDLALDGGVVTAIGEVSELFVYGI